MMLGSTADRAIGCLKEAEMAHAHLRQIVAASKRSEAKNAEIRFASACAPYIDYLRSVLRDIGTGITYPIAYDPEPNVGMQPVKERYSEAVDGLQRELGRVDRAITMLEEHIYTK
jgi:hypothetical protein